MGAESTFIHRSIRETTRALVVGSAGYSLYEAWRKAFVADCPGCGVELREVSPTTNRGILCRGCQRFVEGEDGRLRITPDDHLAAVEAGGSRSRHVVEITAAIPHCGAHDDGAVIGFTPSAHEFFRSHRDLRRFCEANQTTPSARRR